MVQGNGETRHKVAGTTQIRYDAFFGRSIRRVARVKLLWVNAGDGRREAQVAEFARFCDVHQIDAYSLASLEPDGDWDLVCFDFDYPEMAALKLISETKMRWPSVPILMLVLQNTAEIALWALRARVFDLLAKTVTPQEVATCMQRVQGALQARGRQGERTPQPFVTLAPAECRYRSQSPVASRLRRALTYIAKHSLRRIPESEIARVCEMSPSRFCREFKAAFGVTFVEYLSQYRVAAAKRLLANPRISVTDVAAAAGFSDPSYFTRVFRKQEGVSPSEYRASAASDEALLPELASA